MRNASHDPQNRVQDADRRRWNVLRAIKRNVEQHAGGYIAIGTILAGTILLILEIMEVTH